MTALTLYAFPTMPGFFNMSPFGTKAEILLKMADIAYSTETPEDYKSFSKGKLPVLKDGDEIIEDSEFIRLHLARTYGHTFNSRLTEGQEATGHTICRMVEERMIDGLVCSRWVEDAGWAQTREIFFKGAPDEVANTAREQVVAGITQGRFGRHTTEERKALIASDLQALSTLLADHEFFFSDEPSFIDATVFGMLANLYASPIQTWTQGAVAAHANLVAYIGRCMAHWYPEGAAMLAARAAE